MNVLIVEDEDPVARALGRILRRRLPGADVRHVSNAPAAIQALAATPHDLVLLDLRLSEDPEDRSGLDVLRDLASRNARIPVAVVSGMENDGRSIRDVMRLGAMSVTFKNELAHDDAMDAVFENLRQRVGDDWSAGTAARRVGLEALVGCSPAMQHVRDRVRRVARADVPVLVLGETGTGKELVARAIHVESGREEWVARNCAEMQPTLAESTLFGHERGAFTGADRRQLGAFELAQKGTLFLDEVGDLPPPVQAKLLRVLEEKLFRAVGAARENATSARVVAATNADLRTRVREGRFRADLFYRLDVVSIRMPPLRERATDIPELVACFTSAHPRKKFTVDAVHWLRERAWPGNVRELRHMVDRAALLVRSESIDVDELISLTERTIGSEAPNRDQPPRAAEAIADDILAMEATGPRLAVVESALVKQAVLQTHGNIAAAARKTGHNRTTFLRRLLDIKKSNDDSD